MSILYRKFNLKRELFYLNYLEVSYFNFDHSVVDTNVKQNMIKEFETF